MTQLIAIIITLCVMPFSTLYLVYITVSNFFKMPGFIFDATVSMLNGETYEEFAEKRIKKESENNK